MERAPSTRELLNWLKYLQSIDKDLAMERLDKKEGLGVLVKTEKDLEKAKAMVLEFGRKE